MRRNIFRGRSQPKWAYYMHGTPWHETDALPGSVIRKADRLLANGFINSWPPHREFELGEAGGGRRSWAKRAGDCRGTSVARWTFVAELSTAFAMTGNAAYATRCMELMRSNVGQCPFAVCTRG